MIDVKLYDQSLEEELKDFCKRINIPSWQFERLNLDKIKYFCAIYKNKIISINGVRKLDDIEWAAYTRLATDPDFYKLITINRAKGSLCTIYCGSSIPLRYLSKPSIQYCLDNGAKRLVCYVKIKDEEGVNNAKNRKHYFKLADVGLLDYDGIHEINGWRQDKFILNHEKIIEHVDEGWRVTKFEFKEMKDESK
tara:strand:+ start:851 stop:1432 length:582 start_codon:yes stop_codon:yes gene_type:complete